MKGKTEIQAYEIYNDNFFSLKTGEKLGVKDHGSYFEFTDF